MTEPQGDPPIHLDDPGPVAEDPGPHPDDPGPIHHLKLLAAPGLKLRVAAAGSVILVVGALLAPEAAPTALSTPQERAAPLLDEQVQQREAGRPFRGIQDVALGMRRHGVAIPAAPAMGPRAWRDFTDPSAGSQPAGFGIRVSETEWLTHAAALSGRREVEVSTADGRPVGARVVAYEAATGLVLLRAAAALGEPLIQPTSVPVAGMLAVAAGWRENSDVSVPVFITSVRADGYEMGAAQGAVLPGMPVYNLDGELIAIAAVNGRAYPVQPAAARLGALAAAGGGPASMGIVMQDLSGDLAQAFGGTGALVNHVVPAGPAARAGVLPGDAVLAIDGTDVTSAETAVRAIAGTTPGAPVVVRVRRAGKPRDIEVSPATAFELDALAQQRGTADDVAPEAQALFPLDRLDAAGVPHTARLVSVNGRAVTTAAQLRAAVRRGQPTVLLLRHDGHDFFAALEATK